MYRSGGRRRPDGPCADYRRGGISRIASLRAVSRSRSRSDLHGQPDHRQYREQSTSLWPQRFHGVETRIVRIFNTYGERMRIHDGRVVPAFIAQALRNEPMTVFGDGSQTRSFCYVSDLVDGIYRLLMSNETLPVNIGNPAEMSVLQFAQEIKRLTGTKAPIEFRPLPEDDPKIRRPDITKAKTLLGWQPQVPLEVGLKQTIDYFRAVVL